MKTERMEVSFRTASEKDKDQWNNMVLSSKLGQIWDLWGLGEMIALDRGWMLKRFVCEYDGELIGIFPLMIVSSSKLFLIYKHLKKLIAREPLNHLIKAHKAVSLPIGCYGGPIVREDPNVPSCLNHFITYVDECLDNEIIYEKEVLVSPVAGQTMIRSFIKAGYRQNVLDCYVLDLSLPIDRIWSRIDRKCRNEVRQGEKRGVKISEVSDIQGIKDCYRLYLLTLKRQKKETAYFL